MLLLSTKMSEKSALVAITSRIFILLLFCPLVASSCPPSSCGHITDIHNPFRLKTDHSSCGVQGTDIFQLDCQNNHTVFNASYYVQEIDYRNFRIRVVDPGIHGGNLSSCPLYSYSTLSTSDGIYLDSKSTPIAFIHCLYPVSSIKYVKASFCGDRSNIFANSSDLYSYVIVGEMFVSELEESCTVDKVSWAQLQAMGDNPSLETIYDALAYGFHQYPLWWPTLSLFFWLARAVTRHLYIATDGDVNVSPIIYGTLIICGTLITYAALLVVVKFVIGFPLLICLVVHKWRRRHLSMDKTIEDFLQGQRNLAPIQYTYSEIKRMTNNFMQKLGEGGYGVVYKGKLRSGSYAAVKMMEQSMASEEEFMNEIGTIGQIHHCNVVQLIGFCVERSKYGLVYEFLPNGSLDRYLFKEESLGALALTYDKMFEIALGVARGINYLHHGCNMQILHFDIKPHNILLDENFNPKISDFGLARLHPTNESFINLTAARGTMGYMAPEMFYGNTGRITYKADVYSFGMLLMEIAAKRKNMNPLVEDISQTYFPSWVYDHLCAGNDIDVKDATEEEKKMVKKIIIVALWCIQMRPSDRPPMDKVVEMLESEVEQNMPLKPFVAPYEMPPNNHGITRTYSVEYVCLHD